MIKIFPASLDKNTPFPMGAVHFCDDLVKYSGEFEIAPSIESADCILIPQYSNNIFQEYVFDYDLADYIATLKKPIIMHNDGGGIPQGWRTSEIGIYMWGAWSPYLRLFFSVECYKWHRKWMPPNCKYMPFDFVGYSAFGLGLREIRPLQSKSEFLNRKLGTAVSMNVYPPTRDKLLEILDDDLWKHRTFCTYQYKTKKESWADMVGGLWDAKIGFAPDGATAKTERHLFVPSFTVMMKQEDEVEFPFAWTDGENCLEFVHDKATNYESKKETMNGHNLRVLNKELTKTKILNWLDKPNELYEIYANGYRNDENYRLPDYFKNYIAKTIKESL